MDLLANISGIEYTPFLCPTLKAFSIDDLDAAFANSAFRLNVGEDAVAVSWWVSAKRTRTYPYARVYDTLKFAGKKITVIPIFKDEGRQGDRDFLQWDTIALMSLLGVYVIVGYYADAEKSSHYEHKITKQRFQIPYIKSRIEQILSYQSDALHWNLAQTENIGELAQTALERYDEISRRLNVEMHSRSSAERRVALLNRGRDSFRSLSRELAEAAQSRETATLQPKENIEGTKGSITIANLLGGYYYLTVDEVKIAGTDIHLIEAKHSRHSYPSNLDIKDALIKMILYTNLIDVQFEGRAYNPKPILKLTSQTAFNLDSFSKARREFWRLLTERESKVNGFSVQVG